LLLGPNEISIIDPDSIEPIHGAASKCTKSVVYESNPATTSMHSTRSRKDPDIRRKAWAHGFTASGKALNVALNHIALSNPGYK